MYLILNTYVYILFPLVYQYARFQSFQQNEMKKQTTQNTSSFFTSILLLYSGNYLQHKLNILVTKHLSAKFALHYQYIVKSKIPIYAQLCKEFNHTKNMYMYVPIHALNSSIGYIRMHMGKN